MDATRFDDLARALQRHTPRRSALGALGGGLVALLTCLGIDDAAAKKKKRKHKKKCAKAGQKPKKKHKRRCCKGLSKDPSGRCAKPCDVCQPAGACRYATVQAAVDDAEAGATLTLCAGTFTETIEIAKHLTLIGRGDGTGPGNTILDGVGAESVVRIAAGSTVTLQNVRITGGNRGIADGGGIVNFGTLALIGCIVSGNSAHFGGGIGNFQGTLTLTDCTVSGNAASGGGGGIFNTSNGTLELINSRLTANAAGNNGGGILNGGTVICSGSSAVSGNTVGDPPVPNDCVDVDGGTGCVACPD